MHLDALGERAAGSHESRADVARQIEISDRRSLSRRCRARPRIGDLYAVCRSGSHREQGADEQRAHHMEEMSELHCPYPVTQEAALFQLAAALATKTPYNDRFFRHTHA